MGVVVGILLIAALEPEKSWGNLPPTPVTVNVVYRKGYPGHPGRVKTLDTVAFTLSNVKRQYPNLKATYRVVQTDYRQFCLSA